MRTRGRIDGNHAEIVRALRQTGASVISLADMGEGCPDLLVGFRGFNVLLEVKDGNASPCEQRLTQDQKCWHQLWAGQVCVVRSVDEAIKAISI
jgi:Holliday junction resolvase